MSRTFPTTALQNICSPEWVAKTYSEYMLDCANAQLGYIDAVTDCSSNETLENKIDELSQIYDTCFNNIKEQLSSFNQQQFGFNNMVSFDQPETLSFLTNVLKSSDAKYAILKQNLINYLNTLSAKSNDADSYITDLCDSTSSYSFNDLINDLPNSAFVPSCSEYQNMESDIISNKASEMHLNLQSPIALDAGFTTFAELMQTMIRDINSLDVSAISLKDAAGSVLESIKTNSGSVFEQLKASASSAIAWGIGFGSMAKDSLSDKLNYYESQIKTFITDTTEKFASTVNLVRAQIAETANNIHDFFSSAADELGWSKIGQDTFTKVDATDVYSYTGTSPLSAVNIKCAADLGAAVGKTVLAVGYGVFTAAAALLKKAWRKMKPFVMAITDNPVDIGVCDDNDDSYTVTGWEMHASTQPVLVECPTGYAISNDERTAIVNTFNSKVGKWISVSTYIGEIQFTIDEFTFVQYPRYALAFNISYRYKPKCLNYREMIARGLVQKIAPQGVPTYNDQVLIGWKSLSTDNPTHLLLWADFLTSGQCYPEKDEDEAYLYMGFMTSNVLLNQVLQYTLYELYDWYSWDEDAGQFGVEQIKYPLFDRSGTTNFFPVAGEFHDYFYTRTMFADTDDYWVPAKVTNLNFLKVTSGYDNNSVTRFDVFAINSSNLYDPIGNTSYRSVTTGICALFGCFVIQQLDKVHYPSEYLYLPYYNNSYELPSGRYRIKTDAENANVTNAIVNAVVVVVVVLAAVLIVKTLLKVRKNRRMGKLTERIGQMDNDIWSKKKHMTASERRKYFRWKNKLSKLEGASSGLAGGGSPVSRLIDSVDKVQSMVVDNTGTTNDIRTSDNTLTSIYKVITGCDID